MIYLKTGTPGASKTLNTIKEVCEDDVFSKRPIYYNNIKCLALDLDFLNSFQGFFYTQYLRECSDEEKDFLKDTIAFAHKEKRLVRMDEVPFLGSAYNDYYWLDNFKYWIKKLYSKKRIEQCLNFIEFHEKIGYKIRVKQIKKFNLDWRKLDNPHNWYKLPAGSVIIIDEVQDYFGKRSASAKAPEHIAELNTHRHKGFDLILITQDSSLLDYQAKACVNYHIHYKNIHGGEKVSRLESGAHFNVNSISERKNVQRQSVIRRDKKYYGSYYSAEMHTNKWRMPTMYKKLLIVIPILIAASAYGYNKVMNFESIVKPTNSISQTTKTINNENKNEKLENNCVTFNSGKHYCV